MGIILLSTVESMGTTSDTVGGVVYTDTYSSCYGYSVNALGTLHHNYNVIMGYFINCPQSISGTSLNSLLLSLS